MRSEPDKIKRTFIRFSVDEDQIGFDMTVTVVLPFPDQRMVVVTLGKRLIGHQHGQRFR